jgi:hypothetical protein
MRVELLFFVQRDTTVKIIRGMKPMIETHGKVEEPRTEPTMLEQVWGFNDLARYGTRDEAEYRQQLDEMNRVELEHHSRKLGILIVESSYRLKDRLVVEFNKYYNQLNKPVTNQVTPDKNTEAQVRRLLA